MTLKMQLLKFVFGILLNAKHQEQVVESTVFSQIYRSDGVGEANMRCPLFTLHNHT